MINTILANASDFLSAPDIDSYYKVGDHTNSDQKSK